MAMPYSKFYLLSRAIDTYKGRNSMSYDLSAREEKAIELATNLPDEVNKMFDDILAGNVTIS